MHQIINHGYLAVGFFFILSGFVVGYAYDDRWKTMTIKNFLKRRFIRLHPMVVIGAVMFYTQGGRMGRFEGICNGTIGSNLHECLPHSGYSNLFFLRGAFWICSLSVVVFLYIPLLCLG